MILFMSQASDVVVVNLASLIVNLLEAMACHVLKYDADHFQYGLSHFISCLNKKMYQAFFPYDKYKKIKIPSNHIIYLPPGRCTMRTLCQRQSPILQATTREHHFICHTANNKKIIFLGKVIKTNNVDSRNKKVNPTLTKFL